MNAYELKQYIIENDKTKEILESIGCFKIKTYTKEYRCGTPIHDNSSSVSVKRNSLSIRIYGKDEKIKGDIYTLVMSIYQISFPQAVQKIHEILGLKWDIKGYKRADTDKRDILSIFKKALKTGKRCDFHKEELNIIENDILSEYIQMPYIEWVREGITPHTQDIFGVGYSAKTNRVVLPHRYWCGKSNEFVGVIGRTLVKNYKMFEIAKYFPLHNYPKSMNVFGLQENYKGIQEKGYCVVYEAEKSVLKRYSRLDYTATAILGHELSDEQAKILISLDVDIIFALDSDIPIEHVWSICEKFYLIRNVYYIYDEIGLLKEKESPADKPEKVFQALMRRKVKYDEEIHNKYLKYLKESEKE